MDILDESTGELITREFVPVFVRSENNYDMFAASQASGLECRDASRTLQSQAEEADINVLVRRFGVTGEVPITKRMPSYGDFTGTNDYRTALEMVMQAEDSFMQVPAEIRARFHNDPGAFADFCENPANLDELRKMGLAAIVEEPKKVEPTLVRVVKDDDSEVKK